MESTHLVSSVEGQIGPKDEERSRQDKRDGNLRKIEYILRIGLPEYTTARYKQREREAGMECHEVMNNWGTAVRMARAVGPLPTKPLTWNIPYTPLSSTSQLFKNNQRQPMTNRTSRKTEILKLKDEHTKEEPQSFY